jgi:flagellar biogenesis protein FliO
MCNRCAISKVRSGAAVLAVLALLWSCEVGLGSPAPTTSPASTATTQDSTTTTAPAGKAPDLFRGSDTKGIPARPDVGTSGLLLQMFAYVVVILALGAVGFLVVKRVLPRIGKYSSGKNITVVETIYLGPRQAVHMLRVGTSRLLVGTSREGITMLADATKAFAPQQPEEPPPAESKAKAEQ